MVASASVLIGPRNISEVTQVGVLEAMDNLGQHRASWAFEAQDERPALSGTIAELDHFGEPKA